MSILDTILETKREEVARLKATTGGTFPERSSPIRGFLNKAPKHVQLIAEIKKASPSAGVIRPDFHPAQIAATYAQAGADALSVLTDERYFQGSLDYMKAARETVELPVMRKDFLIDEIQVDESVSAGADAVLLVVRALPAGHLRQMLAHVQQCGLSALVEAHDGAELDRALDAHAPIIGINNRDLATFSVDIRLTLDLVARIPDDVIIVSESGIRTADDVSRLADAGVDAILVGETLMRADDIAAKVRELLGNR